MNNKKISRVEIKAVFLHRMRPLEEKYRILKDYVFNGKDFTLIDIFRKSKRNISIKNDGTLYYRKFVENTFEMQQVGFIDFDKPLLKDQSEEIVIFFFSEFYDFIFEKYVEEYEKNKN